MKKIIICAGVLLAHHLTAQATDPQPTSVSNPMDNIKQLYTAAPTANNLMKFEEVPVSNYTGIPDIKIPIVSIAANNQIAMNVSLNYHPLNAKPDDKSSEAGLGWSLFAGGSITRTVRSGPDHTTIVSAPGAQPTIGIYFDEYTSRFQDKNYTRKYLDALVTGTGIGTPTDEFKKLFYESTFLNRYDTEYDLYQYNFMGYTGRFIIKKDSNNQLFVEKLDKNNLRISISALNPSNNFEATAFIITDEQGNKYSFDILEKSTRSILSNKVGFKGHISTNVSDLGTINSSFHISRITNTSDVELVKFNYYPAQQVFYTDTSEIYRSMNTPPQQPIEQQFDALIPAAQETNTSSINTDVRSLQNIEIIGKGNINFTYVQGREDSNFINPQQLQKLDKISITDFSGKTIESYQFDYNYFTYRLLGRDLDDKRLSLTKITKYNAASRKEFDYSFNYNQNNSGLQLGKDHWDWFNCVKPTDNYLLAKEPSAACATVNLLKNIKLPSGGTRVFDFEINTYSYVGDSPIDPYQNSDNWESSDKKVTYLKTESNTRKSFFTLSSPQTVEIQCLVNQILNKPWNISIYKKAGGNYEHLTSIGPATEADPNYSSYHTRDMDAGEYYIVFNGDFTGNYSGTVNFIATYRDKKTSDLSQYLLGGGVRINNISYYDKATDTAPSKKINFSYQDASSVNKSSGALVFPKPVHSYKYDYSNAYIYDCGGFGCKYNFSNNFTIFSSENFLPVQKTQGADVGYQRVVVSETGNGESIYTYKSPIDTPNPEQISEALPPFVAIGNYDFKRGLLVEEQKKDNNNTVLFRKNNQYNTYDSEKLTGINLRYTASPYSEYIYAGNFKTYEAYLSGCVYGNPMINCGASAITGMTAVTPIREIVGKANPNHSESTEYFNGKTLKTIEDITFNARDYPIKRVVTNDGILEANYAYAHEKGNQLMIDKNIISTPLETIILEKQNSNDTGKVLSKTGTTYPTSLPTAQTGNLVLPLSVQKFNKDNPTVAESKIEYNQYDNKGNILQYTTKGNIPTAIIWGYNNTAPIAKIEGATYSEALNLASDIITKSNEDVDISKEKLLMNALDAFRNQSAFKNLNITTYTYDPLIGVTSVTSSTGFREFYKYDSIGRLKSVVDANGNILKENNYNYKH